MFYVYIYEHYERFAYRYEYVHFPHSRIWQWSRVIPKTQKMVLDASLLNTQCYEVRIKGKVDQSREVAIEKRALGLPSTTITILETI